MTKVKHLTTAAEVIEHLGGQTALGHKLGDFSRIRVHNWKLANRFPPDTYLAIMYLLGRSGAYASPSLWGMHPIPEDA